MLCLYSATKSKTGFVPDKEDIPTPSMGQVRQDRHDCIRMNRGSLPLLAGMLRGVSFYFIDPSHLFMIKSFADIKVIKHALYYPQVKFFLLGMYAENNFTDITVSV